MAMASWAYVSHAFPIEFTMRIFVKFRTQIMSSSPINTPVPFFTSAAIRGICEAVVSTRSTSQIKTSLHQQYAQPDKQTEGPGPSVPFALTSHIIVAHYIPVPFFTSAAIHGISTVCTARQTNRRTRSLHSICLAHRLPLLDILNRALLLSSVDFLLP
ncbi:uncharacterized protein F5891DRAFT_1046922 [Suillus fuscotomentosus]|uniref:Uncharacterized protein n=1 Tax=Suillus fuscotomentosus TaxID=1912939 RepID=A0AAD4E1L2_9AGAM|nr:uncharacterized protein F5891DRAFT_1046922 [Suillus fuscotomentosus]KAG1897662.1 hypothetical protein F5891DRAFT_1046922 [Suillus fuscotomentosus]